MKVAMSLAAKQTCLLWTCRHYKKAQNTWHGASIKFGLIVVLGWTQWDSSECTAAELSSCQKNCSSWDDAIVHPLFLKDVHGFACLIGLIFPSVMNHGNDAHRWWRLVPVASGASPLPRFASGHTSQPYAGCRDRKQKEGSKSAPRWHDGLDDSDWCFSVVRLSSFGHLTQRWFRREILQCFSGWC